MNNMESKLYPAHQGEVMLMGDKVFIKGFGHYTKERTCQNLYDIASEKYSKFFECSNCDYVDYEVDRSDWNYCPSCGAKIIRL